MAAIALVKDRRDWLAAARYGHLFDTTIRAEYERHLKLINRINDLITAADARGQAM